MGAPRKRVQEIQEGRGVGGCKAIIGFVTLALRMRRENADRQIQEGIRDRIDGLTDDPQKTSKVFDRGSCRVPQPTRCRAALSHHLPNRTWTDPISYRRLGQRRAGHKR